MKIDTYTRKEFDVQAVRVQPGNLEEVASWCNGTVESENDSDGLERYFVRVDTHQPVNKRYTKAYLGDYVLLLGKSFKVYSKQAFARGFELKKKLHVDHRDAKTGEFVTQEYAEANPDTTVSETSGFDPMDADTNGLGEDPEGHLDAVPVEVGPDVSEEPAPVPASPAQPEE